LIPLRDSQRPGRRPWLTWTIAAACCGVFAWEVSLGPRLPAAIARLAASPAEIVSFSAPLQLPARMFAAMFLHAGWLHLLSNLAFLLVFADDVESKIRGARFLALYLGSGLVATLAQTAVTPHGTAPIVGASGAISGLLGTFLVLFPAARLSGVLPIGCVILPLRTRAFLFLPGWFLLQLASALLAPDGSSAASVAWYAHLAGFAAGPVLYFSLRKR